MATALVTGAGRGIGLAFCRAFAQRGDTVIAACRMPTAELSSLGVRIERGVDVTSDSAVSSLAQRLAGTKIHLLVNNAGILTREGLDDLDLEKVRHQIEVNSIGPLRVTRALLPLLAPQAKVAIITSLMGSMGDNGSGGYYGYRMSKAAVNAGGVSLARDLAPRGIAVALLHPGYVRSDMTNQQGTVDPDDSVRGMLACIDALTLETSGQFHRYTGELLPW